MNAIIAGIRGSKESLIQEFLCQSPPTHAYRYFIDEIERGGTILGDRHQGSIELRREYDDEMRLTKIVCGLEISTPLKKDDRGSAWVKPRFEAHVELAPGDDWREAAERAYNTCDEAIEGQIFKYLGEEAAEEIKLST